MKEAVLVSSVRTACGKSGRGALKDVRPEVLAATALRGALERCPGLDPSLIEDVLMGCAMPEGEQGMNIARIASLKAGLPVEIPAMTINRFCSSGLQAIALAAERIQAGSIECALAGGVESMSMIPMTGVKFAPDPDLAASIPDVYLGMGLTAENLAQRYQISRDAQDHFAYQSHQKALAAITAGKFVGEIVPVTLPAPPPSPFRTLSSRLPLSASERGLGGEVISFMLDEGPRADTTPGALAKLKPAFSPKGTVTAGNASQRSDGAAAAVVMERKRAEQLGLVPLAIFRGYAVTGVEPEVMGIGPVKAIPKLLSRLDLKLEDLGLIELNEAFAVQALAVIREVGLNPEVVNVNGGAIALGHPLGCTGAKLTATLIHEMHRRKVRYGMVTMCIGGGMGAAGIFELP